MNPERAAMWGLVAAVGVLVISLTTGWVIWTEYTSTISGRQPAWGLMLAFAVAGLTANTVFLFVVIGEYLDRELAARGLDRPEM